MNPRQRIAQIIINILVIAELCVSIYLASKDPENFTFLVFKYFFVMLIPTLILGRFVIKRLRTEEPNLKIIDYKERVTKGLLVKVSATEGRKPLTSYPGRRILTEGQIMLEKASQWKSLTGKVGIFFLILFSLAVLDGCQARLRTPLNVLSVLPGATLEITGPLEKKVPVEELTYICTSELIRLSFSEVKTGFWLGGAMWRGHLTVSPDIIPGEYRLMVIPEGYKLEPKKPLPVFMIKVYQDYLSLREDMKSFIHQGLGISPWWIALFCLPFIGLSFVGVFYLSKKIEHLLTKEGKAEVYRVSLGVEGYEIAFGLGTGHGIKPGSCLNLLDESGRPVGTVVVHKVSETDSLAVAGFDSEVKTGYIVSIK